MQRYTVIGIGNIAKAAVKNLVILNFTLANNLSVETIKGLL
jgi:hypothetical protein